MGLWDDIEEDNNSFDGDNQDFSDAKYRKLLINNLVQYCIENDDKEEKRDKNHENTKKNTILNEFFKRASINIRNIPKEDKESILEIVTEHSKLLNSTNSYLKNPIKGMRLISNLIKKEESRNKSKLEIIFDKFSDFLENDFIKFSNQVTIVNEAELYSRLIDIRDELLDDIKFSELVNKTHIGIGGSFSSGKSSFLNSILGRDIDTDDILPTDSMPTTSIPTFIVKRQNETTIYNSINIYTFNKEGIKYKIDRESLLAISHEFNKVYGFGLTSIINKIVVDIGTMPYENIAFLDTPGYSKSDGDNNIDYNTAKNHLKNISAMIWLIDADNGIIRGGDIKFIQSLDFQGDILFIVNKADKKPDTAIKNIVQAIKNTLTKVGIKYIDVVAYSSHDKKEYFSHNKIDRFITDRNIAKVVDFKSKIVEVFDGYECQIDKIKRKNKKILKAFNEIDIYGDSYLIDDFDDILNGIMKDVDKNKIDKRLFNKTKNKFIKFISEIDNKFNKYLSSEEKRRIDIIIAIKYLESKSKKTKKDHENLVKYYSYVIPLSAYINHYYERRAICYRNLKKYKKSIQDYNLSIKINPEKYFLYRERAECYFKLKYYDKAMLDFNKAILLNSNDHISYFLRGYINISKKILKKGFFDIKKSKELGGDIYNLSKKFKISIDYINKIKGTKIKKRKIKKKDKKIVTVQTPSRHSRMTGSERLPKMHLIVENKDIIGKAIINSTFKRPKVGTIAICTIINGKIIKGFNTRIIRSNIIHTLEIISSIQINNKDVEEAKKNSNCGVVLHNCNNIQRGDIIETLGEEKNTIGRAMINKTFKRTKIGTIAICKVLYGKIIKGSNARVIRSNTIYYSEIISSIQINNKDVEEAKKNSNCGVVLHNCNNIQRGDIIETLKN